MNLWTGVGLTFLALMTACGSGAADAGESCTVSRDCDTGLECVLVDDGASVCLPQPLARDPRTCSADADCTASDDQLWPVEAKCLDGACRCLGSDVPCLLEDDDDDTDSFAFILDEETCRCVNRGNEGDACSTSHTCNIGFACIDQQCRSAEQQLGAACLVDTNCNEGTCTEFRDDNDVGICR